MSNNFIEVMREDLADEFWNDVESARDWLEYDKNVVTSGLDNDELCDLFVERSLKAMA